MALRSLCAYLADFIPVSRGALLAMSSMEESALLAMPSMEGLGAPFLQAWHGADGCARGHVPKHVPSGLRFEVAAQCSNVMSHVSSPEDVEGASSKKPRQASVSTRVPMFSELCAGSAVLAVDWPRNSLPRNARSRMGRGSAMAGAQVRSGASWNICPFMNA
mgnify:CR=1 FL=1